MSSIPNSSSNGFFQQLIARVQAAGRWIADFEREMRLVHEAAYKNLDGRDR